MDKSEATQIKSDFDRSATLILLSGGVGQRSGHHQPKQFVDLHGHPMIAHTLIQATQENRIKEIITNAPAGYEKPTAEIMQAYCGEIPFKVLTCGQSRQDSCRTLVESATYNTVVVHEAARPFVDLKMYKELLDCSAPNAGFCYPISFSMCKIDNETKEITDGVSREEVFDIQLPQKFERDTLLSAHKLAQKKQQKFTEDAVMVIKMTDKPVLSLRGSSRNIKVTTNTDILIAKQLMEQLND